MSGFGERLAGAMAERGPLCLGIDPHPELLQAWGLAVDADGLARFSDICVAAFGAAAVVKPQVAFFEAYGAAGFAVLERTIGALRDAERVVLARQPHQEAWRVDAGLGREPHQAASGVPFGRGGHDEHRVVQQRDQIVEGGAAVCFNHGKVRCRSGCVRNVP